MEKHVIHSISRCVLAFFAGFLYLFACISLLLLVWNRLFRVSAVENMEWFAASEIVFLFAVAVIISLLSRLLHKNKALHLEMLASKPEKHNYDWQGGYSIFTAGILWMIMVLRSISVLQFCKLIYRKIRSPETDYFSSRPNVSPAFQEIYFLFWTVLLIAQVSIENKSTVFFALDIYFLIESITWILYYAVFRRFFEEEYSIYHVLEHLPIIAFLIPLQAIAFASACAVCGDGISWQSVVPILLGQANEHYALFSFLGFLYSAIVIGTIISSFPNERIKTGNPETIILGAGNVVKYRLLPAIIQRMDRLDEKKVGKVHIFTLERIDDLSNSWGFPVRHTAFLPEKTEEIYQLIENSKKTKRRIAWIETPSDTHLYYLNMLQDKVDFIVVEKPIVSSINDLIQLKTIISSERRKNIFFLSYYCLEKALPLSFLKRPNSFYLSYLEGDIAEYYQTFLESGPISRIEMETVEEEDNRTLPPGGQLLETFIHHCLIASLFAGLPSTWTIVKFENRQNGNQAYIHLEAKGEKNEAISLLLIKGFTADHREKKQWARLTFKNGGNVEADFNAKTAMITKSTDNSFIVKVSSAFQGQPKTDNQEDIFKEYQGQYGVQCDMVYKCYANNIDPTAVDGLYHQVEVLEWLLQHSSKFQHSVSGDGSH